MAFKHDINLDPITLDRFIIEEEGKYGRDLSLILSALDVATKVISSSISQAGIIGLDGLHGYTNVQGENQQKLDVLSNTVMINSLKSTGVVGMMVSEEEEDIIYGNPEGKYGVAFDPLDGSSNIECNVAVGTIFAIYYSEDGPITKEVFLQSGSHVVVCGYVMYGSATVMTLSRYDDSGVHVFNLDRHMGEYVMTKSNWTLPQQPKHIYSINSGNCNIWDVAVVEFINIITTQHPLYTHRYVGSMVADVHRTLLYGGIFLYPSDINRKGKLRLLYECIPMAYLIEKAGGIATTGTQRILDIIPSSIHERSPIILGDKQSVEKVIELYNKACSSSSSSHPQLSQNSGGSGVIVTGKNVPPVPLTEKAPFGSSTDLMECCDDVMPQKHGDDDGDGEMPAKSGSGLMVPEKTRMQHDDDDVSSLSKLTDKGEKKNTLAVPSTEKTSISSTDRSARHPQIESTNKGVPAVPTTEKDDIAYTQFADKGVPPPLPADSTEKKPYSS